MLGAENDAGQLCGVCHLSLRESSGFVEMKNVHVENIVVDEACRGQGIGKMLLDEAERIAKEWGAEQFNLWCWEFNDGARRLYEARGMHPQRTVLVKKL
jgi:GNAT superfamily N-acetyltransferase